MRIAAMVVLAGLIGMSARAGQVEETVTVYLSNSVIVPSEVLFVSMNLAAKMFVPAGVRIEGRFGLPACHQFLRSTNQPLDVALGVCRRSDVDSGH